MVERLDTGGFRRVLALRVAGSCSQHVAGGDKNIVVGAVLQEARRQDAAGIFQAVAAEAGKKWMASADVTALRFNAGVAAENEFRVGIALDAVCGNDNALIGDGRRCLQIGRHR